MIAPGPDEVELWIVDLADVDALPMRADLATNEQREADAFAMPDRRHEFIRQHGALRRLLAVYLHQSPAEIDIARGANGKPALADRSHTLEFNLSHSGSLMVIGVTSGRRIGVDVQIIKSGVRCLDLAQRFFAPVEFDRLRQLDNPSIPRAFFDLWTLKEAVLKATGEGISGGLNRFSVNVESEPLRLEWIDGPQNNPHWQLRRIAVSPDALAAIAVEGSPDFALHIHRWRPADGPPPR